MGGKARPPRFRSALSLKEAKEIYDEQVRQWHESQAFKDWLRKLGKWIAANDR